MTAAVPTNFQYQVTCDSVAALRNIPGRVGDIAMTRGYTTPGAGGNGQYRWVATVLTDNGATNILCPNGTWQLIIGPNGLDVRQCGAFGDDSTDDTGAIQMALTLTSSAQVYFPAGLYKVIQPLILNNSQVTLRGQGARVSQIRTYHNLGPTLTVQDPTLPGQTYVNGFNLQDITLRARINTTQGSHLFLNKVQVVFISNVTLEDHYGGMQVLGGADHYCVNLHIFSPRTEVPVSWTGVEVGSFFYSIGKSADNQIPTEMFFANFNYRRTETVNYIQNGFIINCVDGLWLVNGHMLGVDQSDMRVEQLGTGDQISGLRFVNCWWDNQSTYGIYLASQNTSATFDTIEIYGGRFLTQSNIAIFADASATNFAGFLFSGGIVSKTGSFGMLLRAGTHNVINAVKFGACNSNSVANSGAICFDAALSKISVTNCQFNQTDLGVTSANMRGIIINAFAVTQLLVEGCSFDLNASMPDVLDNGTSPLNRYGPGNITTKPNTATSVASLSLVVDMIQCQFQVTALLNFANLTSRWDQRVITLTFLGASIVTYNATAGIRLLGSLSFTFKANDTLTLVYDASLPGWREISRCIS